MVNVIVDNTGQATANNVDVTIAITGNATTENLTKPTSPGNITAGGNGTVSWNLNCTGAGDVNITISATGTDNNTGLAVNATPVTHTVHQQEPAALSISFTPATCQNYTVNQTFMVNVTVDNTGEATADNVDVSITITGNANTTENLTKPASPGDIPGGGNGTVSWNLTCTGAGDVNITINATGTDNNTSLAVNATPVTHTVHQQEPAALSISFTPATCQNYTVGQSFMVNVIVDNTGNATANNVNVTITITGDATTTENVTKLTSPGNIPGGGNGTVSWNLTCTGTGDVNITISATGTDANTNLAVNAMPVTHTVHQQELAVLTISFTPATCQNYTVDQEFMVHVTVNNTGGATANNVDVSITITGNANTTESLAKPASPWDIPGGGNGTVSWTLTCTGAGDVNITISATGTDANTNLAVNATPVTHTVHQQKPGGLSGAAIAGIVVGSIAGAVFIFFVMRSAMRRPTV
jgi:phage-related protein